MIAEYCLVCAKGNVREKYEDNYLFFGNVSDMGLNKKLITVSDQTSLIAVFDGIGGMSHGEIASKIAANTLKKIIEKSYPKNSNDLIESLRIINEKLCDVMDDHNMKFGSTASLLLLDGFDYYLCNIGDSPVFWVRENNIKQISVDHTEQKNVEQIDFDNKKRIKKSKLTQHLGINKNEMIIEPFSMSGKIKAGDKFLICSDGLTDMVNLFDISEIINTYNDANLISSKLLEKALENGGNDNVTIISAVIRG